MAGKITEKSPPVKLTVGAQYICFNVPGDSGEWTSTFETEVIKLPTVTQVQITDNADSYDSYASGSIYDSDTDVPTKDIATTNLAFPDTLLAKMKGDAVDEGVIVEGKGGVTRPYFAYGTVVLKKNGEKDLRWYTESAVPQFGQASFSSCCAVSQQSGQYRFPPYSIYGRGIMSLRNS